MQRTLKPEIRIFQIAQSWNNTQEKEIYYYMYPNGYCLFGDMFRSCKLERLSLNIPFLIIQRWKALTSENDLFPTDSLKNEDFK